MGLSPGRVQPKTKYEIGICGFSTKYAAIRSRSKDQIAGNQNSVSEWSDMSTRKFLVQLACTIKIKEINIQSINLASYMYFNIIGKRSAIFSICFQTQ